MKIVIAVLVVIIVVLVVVIIALATRSRRAEVRGEEFRRMRTQHKHSLSYATKLTTLVDDIEVAADRYSDIDSPLAATVRELIRANRAERNTQTP